MPVITVKENGQGERCDRSFIHIQNLPWSACRSEIRNFFKTLTVKKGGILIRSYEAFVALEDPLKKINAFLQTETKLLGSTLHLSVINEEQLQKRLLGNVRRKLDFGHSMGGISGKTPVVHKRKIIRPTPVCKGLKRRAMSSLAFNPEEITVSSPQCVLNRSKSFSCASKKVHPTKVSDSMDVANFDVFHPKMCYEAKRIKLDIRAV